jgi:hypothetical protein
MDGFKMYKSMFMLVNQYKGGIRKYVQHFELCNPN